MEEVNRTRFQGVTNVLRFNWPYFIAGAIAAILLIAVSANSDGVVYSVTLGMAAIVVASLGISIAATYFIYDRSGLYELSWLDTLLPGTPSTILNIHAGFDETSRALQRRFPEADLRAFDCYDPVTSTERSIERARRAFRAPVSAERVSVTSLPAATGSIDAIFLIFAAHEIRDVALRAEFFQELKRSLSPRGTIVLVEHIRDLPNALVYNVGVRHFYSVRSWNNTIAAAGLRVGREFRVTPFVRVFALQHGATA